MSLIKPLSFLVICRPIFIINYNQKNKFEQNLTELLKAEEKNITESLDVFESDNYQLDARLIWKKTGKII
ncbi:MAG: hypothetical protein HRK26_03280 [Rickettsiaceae bacterium H1]|nr:hypothetical protein [Rickettsiaceae bacterium H1]